MTRKHTGGRKPLTPGERSVQICVRIPQALLDATDATRRTRPGVPPEPLPSSTS